MEIISDLYRGLADNPLAIGVILVIALVSLATKELAMIKDTKYSKHMSKYLNVMIIVMVALFVALFGHAMIDIIIPKY